MTNVKTIWPEYIIHVPDCWEYSSFLCSDQEAQSWEEMAELTRQFVSHSMSVGGGCYPEEKAKTFGAEVRTTKRVFFLILVASLC